MDTLPAFLVPCPLQRSVLPSLIPSAVLFLVREEAFVFDLVAEQGLCILGSEDGVVEGMDADSRQFVLRDWRD